MIAGKAEIATDLEVDPRAEDDDVLGGRVRGFKDSLLDESGW